MSAIGRPCGAREARRRLPQRIATLAAACLLAALPAHGQERSELRFAAGADSAETGGSLTGRAYRDHLLRARAGQEMSVSLAVMETDGHGSAYFNVLPPGGGGPAISVGSREGREAGITLPGDGLYAVRVYLMGNDRDAGATVGYSLDVAIR